MPSLLGRAKRNVLHEAVVTAASEKLSLSNALSRITLTLHPSEITDLNGQTVRRVGQYPEPDKKLGYAISEGFRKLNCSPHSLRWYACCGVNDAYKFNTTNREGM